MRLSEIETVLDDFLLNWNGLIQMGFYGTPEENPFILLDIRPE